MTDGRDAPPDQATSPAPEAMPEGEEQAPPGTRTMAGVRWALVALMALAAVGAWVSHVVDLRSAGAVAGAQFLCPMHPQIVTDRKGECPICGMDLVPAGEAKPAPAAGADGATLEVKIQGSVYGEDGKVGMRGRLVTKQGQMLANALLAGVVSGIGQGLATSSTNVSTSPLGTITSASGADAYRAGLGTGVGRALDRLAQYYIKLAENTFPVIEVDAGREIDVVITKGVRIDVPMSAAAAAPLAVRPSNPEVPDDAND